MATLSDVYRQVDMCAATIVLMAFSTSSTVLPVGGSRAASASSRRLLLKTRSGENSPRLDDSPEECRRSDGDVGDVGLDVFRVGPLRVGRRRHILGGRAGERGGVGRLLAAGAAAAAHRADGRRLLAAAAALLAAVLGGGGGRRREAVVAQPAETAGQVELRRRPAAAAHAAGRIRRPRRQRVAAAAAACVADRERLELAQGSRRHVVRQIAARGRREVAGRVQREQTRCAAAGARTRHGHEGPDGSSFGLNIESLLDMLMRQKGSMGEDGGGLMSMNCEDRPLTLLNWRISSFTTSTRCQISL